MNIVFMGTPDFAVPCLETLIKNNCNVRGVITQPDKPIGRSGKLTYPPIKEFALKFNLKVYQPEKVKNSEFIETLKKINPDLIVVVAFGQILPLEILNIPKLGCINVHASLLPKYRGAAPIQWSIINGEKITGVSTMFMDKGMDTGDIILTKEIEIGDSETSEELFEKLSKLGAEALIETIQQIQSGNAKGIKQDNNIATYAPMLNKEDGNINWELYAIEIKNFIRGMYPWPGSYTFYKGNRMKIFDVEIIDKNTDAQPGTIIDVDKNSIYVQTGNGIIKINQIQFDGSKRMCVKDYFLGHSIDRGNILSS
ncbi:MAG: methionyl-tRNA formyltransferase [Bacteroidota bacterium]|nr:methionyl-tRNA formyltransferase [Bacteroidota bacterium]